MKRSDTVSNRVGAADGLIEERVSPLVRSMRRPDLTPAERAIARVLITDYPEAGLLSARALARSAAVSSPTVSRFATKLGYASFQELQEAMRLDLRARLSSPSERIPQQLKSRRTPHDLLNEAVDADIDNLRRSRDQIDAGEFDRLVGRIGNPRGSVYVVGSKKGAVPARYLYVQLNQIREGVVLLETGDGITDGLLNVGPSDLLVAFAPRRSTRNLIETAQEFRRRGAAVAGLCDRFPSPEFSTADYLLTVVTHGVSLFDSYTAFSSLVNGIVAAVAAERGPRTRARMARVDGLNEAFDVWAGGGRSEKNAEELEGIPYAHHGSAADELDI
jgi:DNA-binding MurR/RpiR family transcriptional regulator